MVIVWHVCSCGEPLQYDKRWRGYIPLDGSDAPEYGHTPYVAVFDGQPRQVSEAVCTASPSS